MISGGCQPVIPTPSGERSGEAFFIGGYMREIEVHGTEKKAIVNDCDYAKVANHKWYINPSNQVVSGVFLGGKGCTTVGMHRFIKGLKIGDKNIVVHINGDKFDNRLENLVSGTRKELLFYKHIDK